MAQDTRRHILHTVEQRLAAGESAPPLHTVIEDINKNPDSALSANTRSALNGLPVGEQVRLRNLHREYLGLLSERYGHLTAPDSVREF
jgi:hypothetical protein